jgi:hypothetical protein
MATQFAIRTKSAIVSRKGIMNSGSQLGVDRPVQEPESKKDRSEHVSGSVESV